MWPTVLVAPLDGITNNLHNVPYRRYSKWLNKDGAPITRSHCSRDSSQSRLPLCADLVALMTSRGVPTSSQT
jgi:hypothetical protein